MKSFWMKDQRERVERVRARRVNRRPPVLKEFAAGCLTLAMAISIAAIIFWYLLEHNL